MITEAVLVQMQAVGWRTGLDTFTSTDEAAPNQQHCAGADPRNSCFHGFFPQKGVLSLAAYVNKFAGFSMTMCCLFTAMM